MKVAWVALGSVLRLDQDPVQVEVDGRYPSAGLLNRGRGLFDKGVLSGADTSYGRLFRLREGQFVYSKLFGWEGAIALVPKSFDGHFVSSEFPTFSVELDQMVPEFLNHYLSSDSFTSEMAAATNGLGQRRQRVNIDAFLRIIVPRPGRSDQARVADHLARVDTQVNATDRSSRFLAPELPHLLGAVVLDAASRVATMREICANQQTVIHPGDDLQGAQKFFGLEHIEPHTGRLIGGRAIGDETGRKLLFVPGQVTYGYLRPYLNKAWVADRVGLCSVEQFTLVPIPGVDPRVLSVVLRSDAVWLAAQAATNGLQLPRLALGALMGFEVPDIRGLKWDSISGKVERLTDFVIRESQLRKRRENLRSSILSAARNEIFSAMR